MIQIPRQISAMALASFLVVSGCARNPVSGGLDFVLISEEQELEMGAQYHEKMISTNPPVNDDELGAYVAEIGQALADRSHRPDLEHEFTVIDHDMVNAFALPGGYVYVTRGIMAYFESEAELAGVLGHEIGHVTARHGVRRHATAMATGVVAEAAGHATGWGSAGTGLFRIGGVAVAQGYGRQHELEADRLGAQYIAEVGYDPEKMLDVIGVLHDQWSYMAYQANGEDADPNSYHGLFSSHPRNDQRRQEVIQAASEIEQAATRDDGRERYLEQIDGMVYGPNATRFGRIVDGDFFHPGLNTAVFTPEGWSATRQPGAIRFRDQDNRAQLVLRLGTRESYESPRAILNDYIGLSNLRTHYPLEGGQYPAYTGIGYEETDVGLRSIRFTVVTTEDRAWLFTSTTRTQREFRDYDDQFQKIATSLRDMTDEEYAYTASVHLSVIRAEPGMTYESLAQDVPEIIEDPANRLRLINSHWPDGEIEPGQWVKTLVQGNR